MVSQFEGDHYDSMYKHHGSHHGVEGEGGLVRTVPPRPADLNPL